MFKEDNRIWLYLIGIIVMFGVLIALTSNVIIPFFRDRDSIDLFGLRFNSAPEVLINRDLDYLANLTTSQGSLTIDLFEDSAPLNVNNFVYLSDNNYYNNVKFHRLVPKFLLQTGDRNTLNSDPADDGKGRPGYLVNDEINWDALDLSSERRTILTELGYSSTPALETPPLKKYYVAMANGGPNTNGSQFFILINNDGDSRLNELNGRYTPIGEVIGGFDVLEKISQISVDDPSSNSPRPTQDIVIERVEIFTK